MNLQTTLKYSLEAYKNRATSFIDQEYYTYHDLAKAISKIRDKLYLYILFL